MHASSSSAPRIYLLGRFQITRDSLLLQDVDWHRRKAATLLQCLALEHHLTKDQSIELLWPEASLSSGSSNLYPTLHALRQTLDSTLGSGTAEATFSFKDGVLSLDESVWVDVHEFRRAAQLALNGSPPTQRQLEAAFDLYGGGLLPGRLYDDWTSYTREELHRLYREVRLGLAILRREQGDYPGAISLFSPLLEHNLGDEVVHRELMRTYAYAGRRHDALRQYQTCVNALSDELGVAPELETIALYKQLLSGDVIAPLPATSVPRPPVTSFIFESERLSPFVGRENELKTLLARFEEIGKQGRGKTILLTGDAGVGKTRLTYETLKACASLGVRIIYGAAYEQEEQLPYQPFIEAFDRFLAQSENPGAQNPITNYRKLGVSDPQQEQWALFNSTVTFVTDLAKEAPVVLVVDDIHAADETSLRLFHFLARQIQSTPVALIATYRNDAASASPSPFTMLLNALYREGLSETFTLMRLSEPQVFDMLEHVLGGAPGDTLVKTVFDITEGNPFFVQEISYALVKSDHVEQRHNTWFLKSGLGLSVPSELSALLRERVARLGPLVANTMMVAAVIGREFSFDILHKAVTLSDGEVLDALDAALNAHLLEETGEGYQFRHALIRQTLYDSLSKVRLVRLHTYVAEAIETTYQDDPEALTGYIEALAFHYALSDKRSQALGYLIRSGQKASSVYAFEVAVNYFERALALMDELRISAPEQRWPVLEALGWWCIVLADTPRSVGYFEQALALPALNGWQPGSRDRARAHRGAVMALITAGKMEATEDHLRKALAQINELEDAQEYAHVLYNVAQFHWHRGEYREAFEAAQKSLAVAERLDDRNAIVRAFEMLALACHSLGEWQQGLTYEQQRSALAGATLDVTEAFDVHLCLWEYHLYGDKGYEEIRDVVAATLEQAKRMSAPRAIALCNCFTGALEFQAGNWDVAEAALRESIRLYREIGAASGEALACQRLGVVLTAQERLAEGLAILQEGQAAAERALMRAHCLTRVYAAMARNRLAANDLAGASGALELGLAMGKRHGNCATCDALLLPAAVSVRVAERDLVGAEDFCDRLNQAAEQYASQMWMAMAHQSRAELAAAQGNLDAAVDRYQSAYSAFMTVGYNYEAARCLQALANAYTQRNSTDDEHQAQAARHDAQQILHRLGLN